MSPNPAAPDPKESGSLPEALRCNLCKTTLSRVSRSWVMRIFLPGSSYYRCMHCGRGAILRVFGLNIPL